MEKGIKNNKGITLIALVITIIVLLILAGVSIATLTGDNGLLTRAEQAKEANRAGTVDDEVKLWIADKVLYSKSQVGTEPKNEDQMLADLKSRNLVKDEEIDGKAKTITIDKRVISYKVEGNNSTSLVKPGEIVTETKTDNYTDKNSEKATIPAEFKVSEKADEQEIKSGLVITDGNSEFVWIPVPNPNEMYGTLADGKKAGKLYSFTSTTVTPENWTETDNVMSITSATGFREPDIVTNYDNNTSYNNGLFTKDTLQQEFDEMIESVIKYKGFYVGRYEMSLDANKKAQSKKGETSADASQADTKMWYGLYSKAKTYEKGSIKSTMMWGSQYDSMLKWMQKNNIDVTSITPITGAVKNKTRITGSVETDKLNNVYDILGNSWEWTLEALSTTHRAGRSGSYDYSNLPSYRYNVYPFYAHVDNLSSRPALYM